MTALDTRSIGGLGLDAVCAASGWQVSSACLLPSYAEAGPGQVVCPSCEQPVVAFATSRPRAVRITAHSTAAGACSECGTVHDLPACPGCAQRPSAELADRLVVLAGPVLALVARRVEVAG